MRLAPGDECRARSRVRLHPDKPTAEECKWSSWRAEIKSKTEVWVDNTDDSFYGPYASLVFKKSGAKSAWVAVKMLDMGEP